MSRTRRFLAAITVLGLLAGLGVYAAAPAQAQEPVGFLIAPNLSGGNEVPPNASTASGFASVFLDVDAGVVCFGITTDLAQADITGAHIHEGAAGVNGPVVVDFGNIAADGFTGCVTGVGAGVLTAIEANPSGYYVNVHTAAFPPGEIRDQLEHSFIPFDAYEAILDGDQEVPPSGSPATGEVFMGLDEEGFVCFFLFTDDLMAPMSAAHIHEGAAGVNGPIVVDLRVDLWGDGQDAFGCVVTDLDTAAAIAAAPEDYYINVHTAAHPAGEIRGQLRAVAPPGPPGPGDVDATCQAYEDAVNLEIEAIFEGFEDDPAQVEQFVTEYLEILERAVASAPPEIFEAWWFYHAGWEAIASILASVDYDVDALSDAQLDQLFAIAVFLQVSAEEIDAWAAANCDFTIEGPLLPISQPTEPITPAAPPARPITAAPTLTG